MQAGYEVENEIINKIQLSYWLANRFCFFPPPHPHPPPQATLLFYGTGHRATFEGIQYGAAFLGIDDVSVNHVTLIW